MKSTLSTRLHSMTIITLAFITTSALAPVAHAQSSLSSLSSSSLSSFPLTKDPKNPDTQEPPLTNTPPTDKEAENTPPADKDTHLELVQGEEVFFNNNRAACTLGYIDMTARVAYAAQHCAKPNYPVGATVTVRRDGKFHTIGTLDYPHNYLPNVPFTQDKEVFDKQANNNVLYYTPDIAAIKLNKSVTKADNIYSTANTLTPLSELHVDDKACFYGKNTAQVKCGRIESIDKKAHQFHIELPDKSHTINGDSGGPAFSPDRTKFYGIISGSRYNANNEGATRFTGL